MNCEAGMKYYLILIFISLLFLTGCPDKNKTGSQHQESSIDRDSLDLQYFKKWDNKLNRPVEPISKGEIKNHSEYIIIGRNKKKQPTLLEKVYNNEVMFKQEFIHNDRGNLARKIAYYNIEGKGNFKDVIDLNPLKKISKKEVYQKAGDSYTIFSKEVYNGKGQMLEKKEFDENGKIVKLWTSEFKNGVLSKITLKGQDAQVVEIDKKLYLLLEEFYDNKGQVFKKVYYKGEQGTISHTVKIKHSKNKNNEAISIETTYDEDNKPLYEYTYDKNGKSISYKDLK